MGLDQVASIHARFSTQARWTEALRQRLLANVVSTHPLSVLEVGSGTGVITAWLNSQISGAVSGIDLELRSLNFAHGNHPEIGYAQADGMALPFPDDHFNLVVCHFLLLWTPDPGQILLEMKRCTKPSGWVLAFAEPDYAARIDHPAPLARLGRMQSDALVEMGAHPNRGRQLRDLFSSCGLRSVQAGLLGGEWKDSMAIDLDSEWAALRSDLDQHLTAAELEKLEAIDREAWLRGERVLYIPTFYAMGQKTA